MYIQHFNAKKPWVPKVPWISLDTMWITVWYGSYLPQVMVYMGMGTVWENPTCSIPVWNPKWERVRWVYAIVHLWGGDGKWGMKMKMNRLDEVLQSFELCLKVAPPYIKQMIRWEVIIIIINKHIQYSFCDEKYGYRYTWSRIICLVTQVRLQ